MIFFNKNTIFLQKGHFAIWHIPIRNSKMKFLTYESFLFFGQVTTVILWGKSLMMTWNAMTHMIIYMWCNTFICTILFCLLESSKIIIFKDLIEKIIEAKVAENGFFFLFFRDFDFNYYRIKSLKKVILDNSNRPNKIVHCIAIFETI